MRLFSNHKRLPVRPDGASRKATRFVASFQGASTLLFLALFAGLWPLGNAQAQTNPRTLRAVEMSPISDRNSESDVLGTRPGPLPSFQVNLRNADSGGNLLTPTDNVLVTLSVENQPVAGATPDSDPEALIATNAQPIFRQQQTLLFTPQNYSQPQIVFVQGQDGPDEDGDQPFRVVIERITSGDPTYDRLGNATGDTANSGEGQFVSGVNTDNEANSGQDRAAVKITNLGSDALTDIVTNENGTRATVSVVLTKQPTSDVTVNFRTSDPTEGRIRDMGTLVDSTSLVFSADPDASNAWNVPQQVTIQGRDDTLVDGDIAYRIITRVADTTNDPDYLAIDPPDIIATNNDNEVFGLTISPSFVVVYEGQTATLTASLDRAPTSTVRFSLTIDKPTEVRLNRSELVFEPSNFNVPQTVVVSGVADNIIDGDKDFQITVGNAVSSDPDYNAQFGQTIDGKVIDIDRALVNIQPPGGLETTEAGGTATFQLSLASKPQNNTTVTLDLSSSDTTEGTVTPTTVTFNQNNWNVRQTVTIRGVDDLLVDGDQNYQINITVAGGTGSDPDYALLDLQPVTVVNRDDGENPGVVVTPNTNLTTAESGIGNAQTIRVSLSAEPTANVVLQLRSSNINEGVVSPSRLTFTPTNFATPQVVTITGRDDAVDDGNVDYQIIFEPLTSNDPKYRFDPADLTVTNIDEDVAGITVNPTAGLVTTESGGTATFKVKLQSQPTSQVTLDMTTLAGREISFSPARIIFRPNTPGPNAAPNVFRWDDDNIVVTVTGLDDPVADGNKLWSIDLRPLTSNDPLYSGLNPSNVVGENRDDETPNLFFSPSILVTTEGQGTQFTARLTSKPAFNVRFALSVTDAGNTNPSDEVRLSQSFLLFTPDDYDQPHDVVVTGVRDFVRDGDQQFVLRIAGAISSDPVYSGNFGQTVPGTNIDVDIPGITVNPANRRLETSERGLTDRFTIVLNSRPQPNRTVTVRIASSNPQEGTASPAAITFNTTNWNVERTITVTGVDDLAEDGDKTYQIVLNVDSTINTADPDYNFVTLPSLNAINRDNEKPGVSITPSTGLVTTEAGAGTPAGSATFNVVLNGPPTANVSVQLRSSNPKEGRLVDPATGQLDVDNIVVLNFTPTDFSTAQPVTVQGVDDQIADGNVNYRVDVTVTSGDARYQNVTVPAVRLTNVDNDVTGVIVTPTNGLSVSESGTTATFTVRLRSQPRANVVLGLQNLNPDEARAVVETIVFTPTSPTQSDTATQRFARWDRTVSVTVVGVRDNARDGNQPFTIVTQPLQSTDAAYNGLNPADVRGTTVDIDEASVILIPPSTGVVTSENRTRSRIRINLATRPSADVTIPLSVSDTTEAAIVDPATGRASTTNSVNLVFRASDWPADGKMPKAKEIFVEGVDDRLEDGTIVYQVLIGRPVSSDRNYSSLAAQTLQGSNADNDDRTAPTVTITTPRDEAIVNQLTQITGTADDPGSPTTGVTTGIKKVEVRLFRFDNPALDNDRSGYYNKNTGNLESTFVPSRHLIPATYDEQTKQWTMKLPVLSGDPPSLPSGRYFARATATDKGDSTPGNVSNVRDSERIEFTVDTVAPPVADLKVISPVQNGVYTTLTQVRGTARDNVGGTGIARVRLIVYRYANAVTGLPAGYLSSDGTFVEERTLVEAAGQTDANGVYNFTVDFTPPLEPGQYYVLAHAEDQAGNETRDEVSPGKPRRIVFTIRNTGSGPDDFVAGQTYLISLPYMDSNGRSATTTPDRAFNISMVDPVTGEQRYQLNRFDPLTQTYVLLQPTDTLRRGEGYFIKPLTANVRILRPGDDPTRFGLAQSVTTFVVTLRRSPSLNPSDPNNGFNLIGDPFNPERYLGSDWVNATVQDGATTYDNVAAAAAAGVIDSRLYTFDQATGGYQPVTGNLEPFKGYFVKTFKDNVRVTLKAVTTAP